MSSYVKYQVIIKDFKILEIEDEMILNEEINYNKEHIIEGEKVTFNVSLKESEEKDSRFKLQIISDKKLYEKELTPIAQNLANDLLNKIAFHFQAAKVSEPWLMAANYKGKKMNTDMIFGSVFINTDERDKKILEKLCDEARRGRDFDKDIYSFFRAAMNNEDVVVKYMFLYQILSLNHKKSEKQESQQEVDKFIKSKLTKDKHLYRKWNDTDREETIYTRLRNQVGHFRSKTSQETRAEMNSRISELVELVKLSIEAD